VAFRFAEAPPPPGLTAALARAAALAHWHFGRVRAVDREQGTLDVRATSNAGTPVDLTINVTETAATRVRIAAAPLPPPREVHGADAVLVTRRDADGGVASPAGAPLSAEHAAALLDAQDAARVAHDMLAAVPALRARSARAARRRLRGGPPLDEVAHEALEERPRPIATPPWRRAEMVYELQRWLGTRIVKVRGRSAPL
jgi:hypothetical protein